MTTLIWKLMEPSRSMVKGGKKGTRRLRASCDRCHHAKTRCIYEEDHQDCVRCTARNFTCQRSLSMPRKRTPKQPPPPQIEPYPTPPEEFQTPQSSITHDALTPRTSGTDASTLASSPDERMPSEISMFDFSQFADIEPSFSPMDFGFFGSPATQLQHHPDAAAQEPPANILALAPVLETPRAAHIADGHNNNNNNKHGCSPFQSTSSCLDVLNRTLRDLQQSPVEGKTLDHVLRLNRALLNVVRTVIECDAAHHPSFDFTVYFCLNKLITTYHEALYMPCCASSVQFGSYVVNVEDQLALKCQMILIDVRKIAALLDRLQAKVRQREEEDRLGQTGGGGGAVGRTGGSRCRRQCQFLHRFARNEVDRVTKHIRLLGG